MHSFMSRFYEPFYEQSRYLPVFAALRYTFVKLAR